MKRWKRLQPGRGLSCLERDVMMKSAKLLGIARGDTLMFDSMDETNVLMDFALNEYKVKGKNAIEIYRETANYNEVEMHRGTIKRCGNS